MTGGEGEAVDVVNGNNNNGSIPNGDSSPASSGDGGGGVSQSTLRRQQQQQYLQQRQQQQQQQHHQHQQQQQFTSADPKVPPEMLFKISKKIAQLTKVIYSLNTRNDDLELELGQVRASYEECLRRSKSNPVSYFHKAKKYSCISDC